VSAIGRLAVGAFESEVSRVFTPSAPIDERDLFAGRMEQIRSILDATTQRGQHAFVYGERGVGKTSLANVFRAIVEAVFEPETENEPQIITSKVTCDTTDDFDRLWRKVFGRIEFTLEQPKLGFNGRVQEQPISASDLLGAEPMEIITPEHVRKAFEVLEVYHRYKPVVILDEFDRVDQATRRPVADLIKTISDEGLAATLVVVGVGDSVTSLIDEHSSIARNLIEIQMPRMIEEEVKAIINTGLNATNQGITNEALAKIVLLSQGLPHYAHLLGKHSAREAYDRGQDAIDRDCVDAAVQKSLAQAQETIKALYMSATSSSYPGNLYPDVLLACAVAKTDDFGYFYAADVRSPLRKITGGTYDIPSFSKHLNDFCKPKCGIVLQKIGDRRAFRFRFVDPLLQPYVIMKGMSSGRLPAGLI
jgi:Cdc6-like AAA superfamily ATPase